MFLYYTQALALIILTLTSGFLYSAEVKWPSWLSPELEELVRNKEKHSSRQGMYYDPLNTWISWDILSKDWYIYSLEEKIYKKAPPGWKPYPQTKQPQPLQGALGKPGWAPKEQEWQQLDWNPIKKGFHLWFKQGNMWSYYEDSRLFSKKEQAALNKLYKLESISPELAKQLKEKEYAEREKIGQQKTQALIDQQNRWDKLSKLLPQEAQREWAQLQALALHNSLNAYQKQRWDQLQQFAQQREQAQLPQQPAHVPTYNYPGTSQVQGVLPAQFPQMEGRFAQQPPTQPYQAPSQQQQAQQPSRSQHPQTVIEQEHRLNELYKLLPRELQLEWGKLRTIAARNTLSPQQQQRWNELNQFAQQREQAQLSQQQAHIPAYNYPGTSQVQGVPPTQFPQMEGRFAQQPTTQPYQAPSQQPQPAQQWREWSDPQTGKLYLQDYRTQQWLYQNPTTKEWSYQDPATNQWHLYQKGKQQPAYYPNSYSQPPRGITPYPQPPLPAQQLPQPQTQQPSYYPSSYSQPPRGITPYPQPPLPAQRLPQPQTQQPAYYPGSYSQPPRGIIPYSQGPTIAQRQPAYQQPVGGRFY